MFLCKVVPAKLITSATIFLSEIMNTELNEIYKTTETAFRKCVFRVHCSNHPFVLLIPLFTYLASSDCIFRSIVGTQSTDKGF